MEKTTKTALVDGYITQKKKLEFDLAKSIRHHFNTGTLKIQLNTMIAEAIGQMLEIDGWEAVWNKNAGILKAVGAYGSPANVIRNADAANISPEHCGDFIRLYGEVLEDVEKGPLDHARRAAQLGPFWDKPKGYDKIHPKMDLDTGKYPDPPGTRVRMGGDVGGHGEVKERLDPMSHSMVHKIRKFDPSFDPFARDQHGNYVFEAGKRKIIQKRIVKPVMIKREKGAGSQIGKGMERWIPQSNDLLFRIETTFGLRVGATISGTTTDTIFFLNRFMRDLQRIDPDPIFYILPLATIVSEGHHSLIETALPLALHGKIDYSIGLYSGLLPLDSGHYATGAIRRTLQAYEGMTENRLMLLFFSGPQKVGGCWIFPKAGSDRQVYERMARADENMLRMFANLPKGYATELMISNWYRKSRRGLQNSPALFM